MLHRPTRADRRRPAATRRQQRYRRRLRDGVMPITVEVDAAIVDLLVETRWLGERDCGDRAKIAAALNEMLVDAATKSKFLVTPSTPTTAG
jgi:hypothetical protein